MVHLLKAAAIRKQEYQGLHLISSYIHLFIYIIRDFKAYNYVDSWKFEEKMQTKENRRHENKIALKLINYFDMLIQTPFTFFFFFHAKIK